MRVYRLVLIWILRIAGWLSLGAAIYSVVEGQLDYPGFRSVEDITYNFVNLLGGPLILVGIAELLAIALRSERSKETRT